MRPLLLTLTLLASTLACAAPERELITVVVTPNEADWTYDVGTPVTFTVHALKDARPVEGLALRYEISPEQFDATEEGNATTSAQGVVIQTAGRDKPGFLRCAVFVDYEGKTYRGDANVGFEPEEITPYVSEPADFWQFWQDAIAQVRKVPLEPSFELLPDLSTDRVNAYHVRFRNEARNYIYGVLCVPKKPGKYPAILRVPGAGVRPYTGSSKVAEQGAITLDIGIHGIPVRYPEETYLNLRYGALLDYNVNQAEDRDRYYYKRVFLGCVKAVDFLQSLPEWDGENIGVTGGSQGGALSIITASLHADVDAYVSFYPAMSDMLGDLKGQAGGWPHLFSRYDAAKHPEWYGVIPYYDVVNFARHLDKPGWMSFGYNDWVCPPTSTFAAHNVLKREPELHLYPETYHWTYPEQTAAGQAWLFEQLSAGN
ncbi:MAG: acetylxylan esterase [Verrucomicrobiota bacterium JB022]|nr:acetylxylan esterase [Verrucomicrobiota bacterium JB022]